MQLPLCQLMNSVTVSKCAKRFPILPNQKKRFTGPTFKIPSKNCRCDASAFVNVKIYYYYNARHIPLLFIVGDQICLKSHHGYELPGRFNNKIPSNAAARSELSNE